MRGVRRLRNKNTLTPTISTQKQHYISTTTLFLNNVFIFDETLQKKLILLPSHPNPTRIKVFYINLHIIGWNGFGWGKLAAGAAGARISTIQANFFVL